VKTLQAALLHRVRQWDEDALATAYDEFAPAIHRYAYRLTGHPDIAEEIVSETFHRLLVSLKNGDGPRRNLSAWLYRVAHNLVVDGWRCKPQQEDIPLSEASGIATRDRSLDRIARQQDVGRVSRALRLLTPLQRQVVVLRYLEGLSIREVAEIVQRDANAVKALQHRAINSLKRILKENHGKSD